ncbi:MAG: GNAT family N-acetyltransferase [Roseovarius sp.]|nr:GNAT family N-acetyltransferase [Roseovarius sp.]
MAKSAAGASLRAAVPVDAAALTEVIRAAYAPYRAQGLALPPVDVGIADEISAYSANVAELNSRVVGGVIYSLMGAKAHLMNLAVDPDASGRGIGRALISAAVDAARIAGHSEIHLGTHKDMTETQAFYRSLGWRLSGQEGNKVTMFLPL